MCGRHAVVTFTILAGMLFLGLPSSTLRPEAVIAAESTPTTGIYEVDPEILQRDRSGHSRGHRSRRHPTAGHLDR